MIDGQLAPVPPVRTVRFAFIGDLLFGASTTAAAAARTPERVWEDVLPVLRGADAVFANLEGPVTLSQRRWRRGRKFLRLRFDPVIIDLLKAANIKFVNLANNHILDYEDEGLHETIARLRDAGIACAGAGGDAAAAAQPTHFTAAGHKIGVISFTDTMREYAAGPASAGTNFLRIGDDDLAADAVCAQARALRADGADIVVLSAHWGPNLRPWPPARFRRFARRVTEGGIDVLHGHSAHIVQGLELHGGGVVFYDTGDFIDDIWWFPFVPLYRGALFMTEFQAARLSAVQVVPVVLRPGRVLLARGADARKMAGRVLRLSPPGFGSTDQAAADLRFHSPPRLAASAAAGE